MRITVFGATGTVGSRAVIEALARGHEVTAVARTSNRVADLDVRARRRVADATDPAEVARAGAAADVVIAATRPPAGAESGLVTATKGLLAGLAGTSSRLLAVGGAGSLLVPDGSGRTVLDDPRFAPPAAAMPLARACSEQLEAYRACDDVEWTYLSPAASLQPGRRTGRYRLGTDELLVDAAGRSRISVEDLAVALLDEAEHPRHRRTRFTVAY